MRKSKDSGFLLFLWNREYVNEKITSWHVGTGLQLPSPTHHTGDFFAPHYINLRDDCQKEILPSGWPGKGGPAARPYGAAIERLVQQS